MGDSKIEWTDKTWNPITGCTPISEGCQNCYAARMAKRLSGRYGYPADEPFRPGVLHEDKLKDPFKWRKPQKVFVCSMGDIMHEQVSWRDVVTVFDVIKANPQHIFMILTKRPEGLAYFRLNGPLVGSEPLPNLWLGVTAENQRTADERIPILLQIPAAVRFVSVEPMLGPVDIAYWLNGAPEQYAPDRWQQTYPPLDWVIVGGETGPGARPMHPEWVRSLRDQCVNARVPFFFKQWGEWTTVYPQQLSMANRYMKYKHDTTFYQVGKNEAGRLLDGQEWNQYPEVAND